MKPAYWTLAFSLITLSPIAFLHSDISSFKEKKNLPLYEQDLLNADIETNEDDIPEEEQTLTLYPEREFLVDLKDPEYTDGVLITNQGGVVTSQGIRIQAQNIRYTNKVINGELVQKVEADGELLIKYGDSLFSGDSLEYDFTTQSGVINHGKTFVEIWFMGGSRILLNPDGSYFIQNAFITTSPCVEKSWEINAKALTITKEKILKANNVNFKYASVPIFWLPAYRSDLNQRKDSPVRYKIIWDKALGPKGTMRYRIYSNKQSSAYLRLNYRVSEGPGGSIETNYRSLDHKTVLQTKSYGAYDKIVPDEPGLKHYRVQGLFRHQSVDDRTIMHMSYDKMSDNYMPQSFFGDDFELGTEKQSILFISQQEENAFASFFLRPRINGFESLNQELPSIKLGLKPFNLGPSGVIWENSANAAFLDYIYTPSIRNFVPPSRSVRLEGKTRMYRPFNVNGLVITPNFGLTSIYYTNGPIGQQVGQSFYTYGTSANMRFSKNFPRLTHLLEPYADFDGVSTPKASPSEHFTFRITDGYYKMNKLRLGIRNFFYTQSSNFYLPSVSLDTYALSFCGASTFSRTFPKAFLDLTLTFPYFKIQNLAGYNFQKSSWDILNLRGEFTVCDQFAFFTEFRHRGRYYWRKGNRDNYLVDVAQSIEALENSPLSYSSNTALTGLRIRLAPLWTLTINTHHGWARFNDPSFNEGQLSLSTLVGSSWLVNFTYTHTENDDKFAWSVNLVER